jgi:tetratricopeptide (TPR) repeat protein
MHWITIIGVLLIALGTILTFVGQNISNRENTTKLTSTIQEKNKEIDELVEGKNQLIEKLDKYQKDLTEKEKTIQELEKKAKKAERGISSTFDFNGARRATSRPGHISVSIGPEVKIFKRIQVLEQQKNYPELITICEQQIKKTPEWLTPYLYLGVAYANIGNKEKAIELFEYVVQNAPDDPAYSQAKDFLKKFKN